MRRQLGEVVAAMLQIAGADALDDATRQLAAEFLITLCEARDKAPGMMRKLPSFAEQIFQIMLKFLLDIEVSSAGFCSVVCSSLGRHRLRVTGLQANADDTNQCKPCRTTRSGTGQTATSTRTRGRASCTSLARSALSTPAFCAPCSCAHLQRLQPQPDSAPDVLVVSARRSAWIGWRSASAATR